MLLYKYNTTNPSFLLTTNDPARNLWIFVIAEHIVLIVKFLCAEWIEDKPKWVLEEEERQLAEKEIDEYLIEKKSYY